MAEIFASVVSIVCTGLVGLCVWAVQDTKKSRDEARKAREEARMASVTTDMILTKAMLVILRNQMVSAHSRAIREWKITVAEKSSYIEMWRVYRDLGGDGPVIEQIEDLERVKLVAE